MQGDSIKWRKDFDTFERWDSPQQRNVQKKEADVILRWLCALNREHYAITEIGCGNGYVGSLIVQGLIASGKSFSYQFTDLLPECIDSTKETTHQMVGSDPRVTFLTLDIYRAVDLYGPASHDIIVSTGFASAATYRDVIPFVAQLLKENGILIADFVNHASPALFFANPILSIKRLVRFLSRVGKMYHFGVFGLKRVFGTEGLRLVRHQTVRFRRNPVLCMFIKSQS